MASRSGRRLRKSITLQQQMNQPLHDLTNELNKTTYFIDKHDPQINQNCHLISIRGVQQNVSIYDNHYALLPTDKLNSQIARMEDALVKTEKQYNRKMRNLVKKLDKQNQRELKLAEQVMILRSQLAKNLSLLAKIRNQVPIHVEPTKTPIKNSSQENKKHQRMFRVQEQQQSIKSKVCSPHKSNVSSLFKFHPKVHSQYSESGYAKQKLSKKSSFGF